MSKKIAIIGLGWVGKPLALKLIAQGHKVLGTTTSVDKKNELTNLGIITEELLISSGESSNQLLSVEGFDVLIIAITPGFKRGASDYAQNVKRFVNLAEQRNIKQIVLLSSSGVYTSLQGNVDEESTLAEHIDKVAQLKAAEQAVLNCSANAQVLRLAGLVGPHRLPGKFLAGKKNLRDPYSKVHLIHLADVLGILEAFIDTPEQRGIYNCVSPTDITRQDFYQQAAIAMELEPPSFVEEAKPANVKVINGEKLQGIMGYQFIEPDITQWVKRSTVNP